MLATLLCAMAVYFNLNPPNRSLGASQVVLVVKNLPANVGDRKDQGLIPGLGRSSGGRHGSPLQYSCLENSHGQRSLAGYSPQGRKELDMTEAI